MKISTKSHFLKTAAALVAAVLLFIIWHELNLNAKYEYRNSFNHLDVKTFLAICTDKKYLNELYGEGNQDLSKQWLVGEIKNEGEVDVYPLVRDWEYSSLSSVFTASPHVWNAISPSEIEKQFSVGHDHYKTIFLDSTLKCEVMLSDVNKDGKMDVILRKTHIFDVKSNSIDETICAYDVANGRAEFLEY